MAKQYSAEGDITLQSLAKAEHFNRWMVSIFLPYIKGRVLEVGSGTGNLSKHLVRVLGSKVVLSDIDANYVKKLKLKFPDNIVVLIDLENEKDFVNFKNKHGCVNAVISFNVLEHVKDDFKALSNMSKILCEQGRILFLVPAHPYLYNSLDEAFGHYRRYDVKRIIELAKRSRMKLVHIQSFNSLAIIGWVLYGHILRRKYLKEESVKLYDLLTPLIKKFDKHLLRYKIGISYAVVLEKIKN